MKKESGVRSQEPEAPRDLTGGSDIVPAASAASLGVRELAPALEPPASVGPRETSAPEGIKRRQGAALQSAQGAASSAVRELAPALEPPASGGPRETSAPEGIKRRQGAALQSTQGAASRRKICADVTKLAPEWREQVENLIVDGFTFDDVVEILKEREGPRVTLHALEVYYQSNLDLQKRRIKHLIEKVDKLKNAMAHPTSTEAQLADATLFTGLLRVSRRHAQLTVKDAQSLRLQRENLQLRKRVLKMKLAEAVRKKSEAHQRYLFEEERRHKLTLQNQQLEEILKKLRQDQTLPADVMGKIQEIYGIVKEPYLPPKLAEQLRQPATL